MPSPRHDTINLMFRDHPALAVKILRELMDVDLPPDLPVRLERNDFNDRPSKDFQPDTVITVGPPQKPTHGIVVEVQQEKSDAKRRQLPRYAAAFWLSQQCPVTVLCICPNAEAAIWYAKPTNTELPGFVFQAAVLGPRDVPVITNRDHAVDQPELAAMAVMVHGRDRRVIDTFMAALEIIKPAHALQYYEYAYGMAAPAVRRVLEEIVASSTWPLYSPFAREHFGRGEAKGRTEGRTEGRAEGRVEGRVEGRAEGEANALLRVLSARGIEVPKDVDARIRACTDIGQLNTWLDQAVTAVSITDLFE